MIDLNAPAYLDETAIVHHPTAIKSVKSIVATIVLLPILSPLLPLLGLMYLCKYLSDDK